MSVSRRDFLRNSGLAVMAGGTILTAEQWLAGADLEDEFRKKFQSGNVPTPGSPGSGSSGSKEPASVIKRMKDKAFARAVSRDDLRRGAEELGLPLDVHITNVIGFLREQAAALGLAGATVTELPSA